MLHSFLRRHPYIPLVVAIGCIVATFLTSPPVHAATALPTDPQNGSVGLEGTISSAPPTGAATISVPSNGQSFTTEPITVSGLCTDGLLIKLFSNGVFIGSAECSNGSYSISAALFDGQNQLIARDYDALDQAGPDSNQVTVSFTNNGISSAQQVLLTSSYASRGAAPGTVISWPIGISGGTAPYAVSVDWGDNSSPELLSETSAGTFTAQHTYKQAGVYNVLVKAVDKNGAEAFLQLVGVGNGALSQNRTSSSSGKGANTTTKTTILWWPAALMIPLILIAFWLGRRYERAALIRHIEQSDV